MKEIPFSIQWPIAENRLLPLKESVNGCLSSDRVSNNPAFEYYLRIYPNGTNEDFRGETWILLNLKFKTVKKVEVDYTLTIDSCNYSKKWNKIYEKSTGWGCFGCKTNEFFDPEKKYIFDGKFIVKVDGIFKFETENDAIPAAIANQQNWSSGKLGDGFWKKDDTKDFTIIVGDGGKEIKIHKYVLDVRSEVFTAMIQSNMKEATENKVTISDFSYNVVETGIKLIYECNFTSKLSMDELISLLQFFDKYLLQELKAKVEPYLIAQISPSTVVRLTNCSILTNSIKLKEKCMEYLLASFAAKTPLSDIKTLDKEIALQILENSFCLSLETKEQQ